MSAVIKFKDGDDGGCEYLDASVTVRRVENGYIVTTEGFEEDTIVVFTCRETNRLLRFIKEVFGMP